MKKPISLTVFVSDIWFQHGKPIMGYDTPASNYVHFRTIKKARQMARGILNRWPDLTVTITRRDGRFLEFEEWSVGK